MCVQVNTTGGTQQTQDEIVSVRSSIRELTQLNHHNIIHF
jgi:hypothetical protein